MNSRGKTACAAAGLACAFGGAWTSDAHIASLSGLGGTTIWMRVASLAMYFVAAALVFAMVLIFKRNGGEQPSFKKKASILIAFAALCLAASVACQLALVAGATGSLGVLCGFGMKIAGPPLTIALACGFSRLSSADVTKASFIGIAGAFLLETALTIPNAFGEMGAVFGVYFACLLSAASLACAYALLNQPQCSHDEADANPDDALRIFARRGQTTVFTIPFLVTLVSTAIMLGFLHSGLEGHSASSITPSIAAALTLLCIIFIVQGTKVSIMNLLIAGLVCVAAGFLIGPLVETAIPDAQNMLSRLGTTILEAAAWVLTVYAARNSRRMFLAACVARLCTVTGHLLGALLCLHMVSASAADTGSLQAGSLVIVFAYFLLGLFLSRSSAEPSIQASNASGEETSTTTQPEAAAHDVAPEQTAQSPLGSIADTFGLTARERDVFARLASGCEIATIENELCISRNTAKMHIRNVYRKLDVHSKQELQSVVENWKRP